jgi:hypothetical protein
MAFLTREFEADAAKIRREVRLCVPRLHLVFLHDGFSSQWGDVDGARKKQWVRASSIHALPPRPSAGAATLVGTNDDGTPSRRIKTLRRQFKR